MELDDGLCNQLSPDPGDDTASRFRYQWCYAAILCCGLLDTTLRVSEIFCEHHEDILVKRTDDNYIGIQVKTKRDDQESWAATDQTLVSAFTKFVILDNSYQNMFVEFIFSTNHTLVNNNTGRDIQFILQAIKLAEDKSELTNVQTKWMNTIADSANVTLDEAFLSLKKSRVDNTLPKLSDILIRLIHTLNQSWSPAKDCSIALINKISNSLVEECGRASSLDHDNTIPGYFGAFGNQEDALRNRIIGKKITLERLNSLLNEFQTSNAILNNPQRTLTSPGEGSTELLIRKLDEGGFSSVSINSAEELRDRADYLGLKWINQYGGEVGLGRYQHINTVVLSDAGKALDHFADQPDRFGPRMRKKLIELFRERRNLNAELFDATDDHLEGFAFSLTAQCKVAWSHNRPWETE